MTHTLTHNGSRYRVTFGAYTPVVTVYRRGRGTWKSNWFWAVAPRRDANEVVETVRGYRPEFPRMMVG